MAQGGWNGTISLVVAMLRTWSKLRQIGENPLPSMHVKARPRVRSPEFIVACDSLFALTEAVLGRALVPARCCSAELSRDEAALLSLLRYGPGTGAARTSRIVPHGLPEALRWAIIAVRRSLDENEPADAVELAVQPPARCPFGEGLDEAA